MASSCSTTALLCFSSPNKPPLSSSPSSSIPMQPQPKGRRSDAAAVYVATVPLRASGGPPQMLMSAAHSLGVWDLQHFMVIIKPGDEPSPSQATAFDFQPQDPESIYVALAALSGRQVPGVILKRTLKRLPKRRCWFVGFSHANSVEVADKFSEEWSTDLIVGKHDCRHYTNGLVQHLTGEQNVLDFLRETSEEYIL
ncbi:uncharacterized protein M6B38_360550 [Iris pallida]|uniref:Uncharacterized protein n=1 Tax=Iris pallida TaxID=29817 RepID=A0AAX6GL38_IRIPA|nr:uncharacterized protein M6B38_360550 [Iris pallida]